MDYQEKFNHEEIEAIANKFLKNEFVNHEELKVWYDYKRTLKADINNATAFLKRIDEAHKDEPDWEEHEVTTSIRNNTKEAKRELQWIRNIVTFPLKEFCDYYYRSSYHLENSRTTIVMAKRVIAGVNRVEERLIRELFEESETLKSINNYRDITTPVALRHWYYAQRNPTEYCHFVSSMDATKLYDEREHYVYIESECTNHRWGESYWISVDCENTLYSLPVIKDFKNYDFEVGKFYKIQCTNTIYYGGNKKKYCMDIEPCSEEEFMEKGLEQYIRRKYY